MLDLHTYLQFNLEGGQGKKCIFNGPKEISGKYSCYLNEHFFLVYSAVFSTHKLNLKLDNSFFSSFPLLKLHIILRVYKCVGGNEGNDVIVL